MNKCSSPVLFIILVSLFFLISCSKDNSNSTSQPFRVTDIISNYTGGFYDSIHFSYEGELISSYYVYRRLGTHGIQEVRFDFNYPDPNTIIHTYNSKATSGNWVTSAKNKSERFRQGDVKTMNVYVEKASVWQIQSHTLYTYSGDRLDKIERSDFNEAGDTAFQQRETFSYLNELMQESVLSYKYQNEWKSYIKKVAVYAGNQMEDITIQYYNPVISLWDNRYLITYQFINNKMSRKESFLNENGNWDPLNEFREFGYDTDGNLVSEHSVTNGTEVNMTYHYEKGNGNYTELFWDDLYTMEFQVEPRATSVSRFKEKFIKGVAAGKYGE